MDIKEFINKDVILKKISDLKFKGNHPNNINEGYEKKGILTKISPYILIEGDDSWFHTSLIEKIEGDKIYTKNSIYTINLVNNE